MREQLMERSRMESDHRMRGELIRKLTGAHEFELPDSLVEYQSRQLVESTMRDMMQRGIDPRTAEINWEGMRDVFRARAEEDLRGSLLLERIAEEENIEPSQEEINQEIESFAAATRQTTEQVRAALTKQGGERSIADRLRHRMALDLLVENARVSDEEWREDEVVEESDAAPETPDDASPDESASTGAAAASASQGEGES
jgi:trigger factor